MNKLAFPGHGGPDREILGNLDRIADPDNDYVRLVEAELSLDAQARR
jgi:hypothetical protein